MPPKPKRSGNSRNKPTNFPEVLEKVRLPEGWNAKIKAIATKDASSPSQVVRDALRAHFVKKGGSGAEEVPNPNYRPKE